MKKRFIMLAGVCMLAGVLSGCGSGAKSGSAETGAKNESTETVAKSESTEKAETAKPSGKKVINVWAFTDEVPKMIEKYKEFASGF